MEGFNQKAALGVQRGVDRDLNIEKSSKSRLQMSGHLCNLIYLFFDQLLPDLNPNFDSLNYCL